MIPRRIPILLILLGGLILGFSLFPIRTPMQTPMEFAGTWRIPVPTSIPVLNPQVLVSPSDKNLALLAFSRLVRTDEYMEVLPDLLESWSFDLNRSLAHLKIRSGARFHDGRAVSTDDLIFSFHQWGQAKGLDNNLLFLIEGAQEYAAGHAPQISGLRATSPQILTVRLTQPAPEQFIAHLAQPRFCVYPKDFGGVGEAEFFSRPVGTGPFKLASYSPERVEFIANENFHLGRPKLNSISVLHLNMDSAITAFKIGEIDNLIMFQPQEPMRLQGTGIVVRQLPAASTLTAVLNSNHPDLQNPITRKAVARLLYQQKKLVANNCFPGSQVANSYIPPGLLGHVEREERESDEPALPKFSKWKVPLTLYASPTENGECVVQNLKTPLSTAHIGAETKDTQQLFRLLQKKKVFFWTETFSFKSDEAYYNFVYYTSASPEFLLGLSVPFLEQTFSRLSIPGLSTVERGHLYNEMDDYLVENAHIVPIAHFNQTAVYRARVRNLEFLSTGRFAANWHQIEVARNDDEPL